MQSSIHIPYLPPIFDLGNDFEFMQSFLLVFFLHTTFQYAYYFSSYQIDIFPINFLHQ